MKKNKHYRSSKKNKKHPPSPLKTGTVKRHPDGFGFFIPDDQTPDLFISFKNMHGLMTGDQVQGERIPGRGNKFALEVKRVKKRALSQVVGALEIKNPGFGILKDKSHTWGDDMKVIWKKDQSPREGEGVLVKILSYPGSGPGFRGEVVKVLGDLKSPLVDIERVLLSQQISTEFPPEAEAEARQICEHANFSLSKGRKDLKQLPFVTIDGVTAKDFDDAIFVKKNNSGFKLYVAIADVSAYVKPGSPMDREAYARGNSTYLPNFVTPMLPKELSDDLCSLRPKVPRFVMVAEIDMNFEGEILSHNFYEGLIHSHARLTYNQVQAFLDKEDQLRGQDSEACPEHVVESVKLASELAHILLKRRRRLGSLEMDIPETQIVLDSEGEVLDVFPSQRVFAHRLIEELMLVANQAVAKLLVSRQIKCLHRIHEDPDAESLEALRLFAHNVGVSKPFSLKSLHADINQLLIKFESHPGCKAIQMMVLRCMQQAVYSADHKGHFGLNFKDYAHFTSPIRRYADLVIHRQLKYALWGEGKSRTTENIQEAGAWLSACERRSVMAERKFAAIKKARFMSQFVGQAFPGVVSSVKKFGLFVFLRDYDIEGLVSVEDLGCDVFQLDEAGLSLVGVNSGFTYKIGMEVEVQVAAVNPEEGQIDFVLANEKK